MLLYVEVRAFRIMPVVRALAAFKATQRLVNNRSTIMNKSTRNLICESFEVLTEGMQEGRHSLRHANAGNIGVGRPPEMCAGDTTPMILTCGAFRFALSGTIFERETKAKSRVGQMPHRKVYADTLWTMVCSHKRQRVWF